MFCRILFLFLICSAPVASQDLFFKQVQINRDNLNLGFNKLAFDNNRSLWLATSEGLYNYNGTEFTIHQFNKAGGPHEATAVFCDSAGKVWAGMKSGNIALMNDTTLSAINVKGMLPHASITSIYQDKDGWMWFTTGGDGAYYLYNDSLRKIDAQNGLTDDYVYVITEFAGKLWMGTDQGITVVSKTADSLVCSKIDLSDGLPDFIVRDLKRSADGNLWIALQDSGICMYNNATHSIEIPSWSRDWKYGQVNSLLVNGTELWIATEASGLLCRDIYNGGGLKSYSSYQGLRFQEVRQVISDAEGSIWMIAQGGLLQSHGNWLSFMNEVNGSKINFVHTVYCTSDNEIIFSPDQGLSVLSRKGNGYHVTHYTVTPSSKFIDIVSLHEDDCGNIWIGTMGDGLYRLNRISGRVEKINHILLEGSSILSIDGDENNFWLATFGGAFRCSLDNGCNEPVSVHVEKLDEVALGNFYIYTVFVDSRGRVWFGTDKKGLVCYDGKRYINFTTANGLRSNTIFSITEDRIGALWMSVGGEGISRYDGRTFKNYGAGEGLRELSVSSVKAADGDKIIMVNRRGIDVLHSSTGKIDYYGASNNLIDINPDINSITVDKEGAVWIGTEKGLVIYKPELSGNPAGPSVFIQRVSLFGSPGNLSGRSGYRHNENNLSFYFTGIWYTDPERINYQYMLEGYNDNWINTRDRHVVFPNLPPGKYEFKVRASLSPAFVVSHTASYKFSISKPFWRESWFIIIMTMLLSGAAYIYIRARDRRLKRIEALKKESVEYHFETLKSQVNPHFLFNSFNTLIAIIEKDRDIAIEYVEKLSDYFRNMIQHREKELISLREEIEMVKTYYYLQKKRFGDYLQLSSDLSSELLVNKKVPPLSLQLLIENAIKHNAVSKETPLKVEIFKEGENSIVVRNNINEKINKEVSTGIGLQNIINRYKMITNEKVTIKNNHSCFSVTIPLID